jgi:prepilin-type N-terminal cleavage/methylation domain-containing protein
MKSRGFTLIELAVVLAIIAVLAAVLTPMVTGYIDQARIARATADIRSIADAARLYQRDVGEFPIFKDTTDYTASTSFNVIGSANGTAPTDNASTYLSSVAGSSLETYLNINRLNRPTTATLGRTVFKGPYIGNLDADPWGSKYYITGSNLENGSANWGFVISAGPDTTFDTTLDQPKTGAFTVGDDDIVAVIR